MRPSVLSPALSLADAMRGFPAAFFLLDGTGEIRLHNDAARQAMAGWGGESLAGRLMTALGEGMGTERWGELARGRGGFAAREVAIRASGAALVHRFTCTGHWLDAQPDDPDADPWLLLAAWEASPFQKGEDRNALVDLQLDLLRLEMVRKIREALTGAQFHFEAINSLLSSALALGGQEPSGAVPMEVLTLTLEAGRRAVAILSRAIPAVEPEPVGAVNLNAVLRDVLTLFTRRMLSQGVRVTWRPTPDNPLIHGQEKALRVAFKELIENALDAMNPPWRGPRELAITVTPLAEGVRITVADSGPGIQPEDLHRVFQPFFSRKPGGCGAGVGLPLIQEIVQRHGGALELDPGESAGCRFHVLLPPHPR